MDSGRDTGLVETLVVEVDVERDCGSRTSKVKFCNRYLVIYPVYDATEYRFKRYTERKKCKRGGKTSRDQLEIDWRAYVNPIEPH